MHLRNGLILALALAAGTAHAASEEVTMHRVTTEGIHESIGTVTISETEHGLVFTPHLNSLPAGLHGFHVHETGSCEAAELGGKPTPAGAAGGHYDPDHNGLHLGPYLNGHLGDLPALYVTDDGKADYPVLAPRLKKLEQIKGRALMVHVGADNHSDQPEKLGGGGARMACGVISE